MRPDRQPLLPEITPEEGDEMTAPEGEMPADPAPRRAKHPPGGPANQQRKRQLSGFGESVIPNAGAVETIPNPDSERPCVFRTTKELAMQTRSVSFELRIPLECVTKLREFLEMFSHAEAQRRRGLFFLRVTAPLRETTKLRFLTAL